MTKAFLKICSLFFIALIILPFQGCKKKEITASVMLVHGAPGTPEVDLFLQGNLKQSAIAYGSSSAYQEVSIEETEQFTSDIKDTAADTTLLSIFDPEWLDGEKYSIVIYGEPSKLDKGIFSDDYITPAAGSATVRFIHLSPNAPPLDVLANGVVVVTNKEYYGDNVFNGATGFQDVEAGIYDIELRVNGTNNIALSVPNITFADGKAYTIFATGFVNGPGYLKLALGIAENN
ncbi:MAG TPA: DUF4397 domain-containing protein [Chitinophagales bacterium]|nr:DUF4397 domain-containing protein [Chitinophagales bacterium]